MFLLYLSFFWVQMGQVPRIKRSQFSLAPLFQKSLIKGQVLVNQFWSVLILNSCFSSFSVVFYTSTFFLTLDLFSSARPTGWKDSIGFSDRELHAESFENKKSFKKSNIQEAFQTMKITSVVFSRHMVTFRTPKSVDSKQKNQL